MAVPHDVEAHARGRMTRLSEGVQQAAARRESSVGLAQRTKYASAALPSFASLATPAEHLLSSTLQELDLLLRLRRLSLRELQVLPVLPAQARPLWHLDECRAWRAPSSRSFRAFRDAARGTTARSPVPDRCDRS